MKQFLFKVLGVPALLKHSFRQGEMSESMAQKERDRKRIRINYPVGSKVMVIGNSPPPPDAFGADDVLLAEVIGYESYGRQDEFLLLRNTKGEEFTTMAKVIHFDEARFASLQKLAWWERWNVVTEWGPSLTKQTAMNLEANRPAWDNGDGTVAE
jgi:hypothetical protein